MMAAIRAAQNGDETATLAVLDSVEGIVRRAVQHRWRPGMDVDDMVQEGRVAALEALKRYDPEGGAKFSTYTYLRITRTVADYAATPPTVHVPPRAVATFRACLGNVGGDTEAAEYLATLLPGPGHRMSAATAHAVRVALQPAESWTPWWPPPHSPATQRPAHALRGRRTGGPVLRGGSLRRLDGPGFVCRVVQPCALSVRRGRESEPGQFGRPLVFPPAVGVGHLIPQTPGS